MASSKVGGTSRTPSNSPSLRAALSALPRRVSHGGAAWLRRRGEESGQPQDGAINAVLPSSLSAGPRDARSIEGEDAGLTGGTRSLMRRLTGLNVTSAVGMRSLSKPEMRRMLPRTIVTT